MPSNLYYTILLLRIFVRISLRNILAKHYTPQGVSLLGEIYDKTTLKGAYPMHTCLLCRVVLRVCLRISSIVGVRRELVFREREREKLNFNPHAQIIFLLPTNSRNYKLKKGRTYKQLGSTIGCRKLE